MAFLSVMLLVGPGLPFRKAGRARGSDLRRRSTRLIQAGVDLYKVQRLLGHQSPVMAQRYAHHSPESLRDGVEILDRGRTVSTILAQSAGAAE